MRQAIVTKYICPTNTRGSRISAKCQAGKIVIPYDDGLDQDEAHGKAARALIAKLGWYGEWTAGGLPDGRGNCYAMREFKGSAERKSFVGTLRIKING
jgi:hypothetical protein